MKLSRYIEGLQKILEENGDLECYYAKDDEGNGYNKLYYDGTVMYKRKSDGATCYVDLRNLGDKEYHMEDDCMTSEEFDEAHEKVVCVN